MEFGNTRQESAFEAFRIHMKGFLNSAEQIGKTKLRDYQAIALEKIRDEFIVEGTHDGPKLLVFPTGSGKSGIISLLPYVLGSSKVMVLSPSLVITNQLANEFGLNGVDRSFYLKIELGKRDQVKKMIETRNIVIKKSNQVENMDMYSLVIVNAQKFGGASNNALIDRDDQIIENVQTKFKDFDTLIVDEAHHYPAKTWKDIVEQFNRKKIIFLTATPYRGGNEPILEEQKIVYSVPLQLLKGKYIRNIETSLENPLVYEEDQELTDEQVTKIGRDIDSILDRHDKLQPSIEHKAMVLVSLKEDAKRFSQSDLIRNATYLTSDRETDSNKSRFENGTNGLRILFVCGRLLEGYDNSDVSVCVILRKVRSMVLFTQFVGRCLRKSSPDDKVPAVVLSYTCYQQKCMFERLDRLAVDDPQEENP